jgi:hypothetical protein
MDVIWDTYYERPEITDPQADSDEDGIKDGDDNCPFTHNSDQLDTDGDDIGDVCDPDIDGDGVPNDADCQPLDPSVFPGAIEVCDGKDNDCDGKADVDAAGCVPMYLDADGDQYGVQGTEECLCFGVAPANRSIKFGDCNDSDPDVHPGANEVCDDIDNNCDGQTDEGCDEDGDGWCNADMVVQGTPAVCPNGQGDCEDRNPHAYPGAYEDPSDGIDNNCNGVIDEPIQCPGPCTGHTVPAYLCAMEMCFEASMLNNPGFSSPTGDNIDSAWEAVAHYGNTNNDLKPLANNSYALLGTGPVLGNNRSVDLSGGSSKTDPYTSSNDPTYDNVEFTVTLTAPPFAIGFAIDYIFMSVEYEEYIGTQFNDKFYVILKAPQTTGNQNKIVNFTDCRNPNSYHDFVDSSTGKKQCYIAINTAFSEPCSNPKTKITGTGFACCKPDTSSCGSSTGWLVTRWPIEPSETFQLTFHIHDTGDGIYDSAVILDNFHWISSPFVPGTASHN